MKIPLNLGIISLVVIVACSYLATPPYYFFGEHKLTDGMTLKEPQGVNYSLSFNSKLNLLFLKGSLDIGVVAALEQSLAEHPGSKGIVLDSEGGNIYQARGVARLIQKHLLNTYSFENCYSACTLAYVAGKRRYLGPEAKLGFHCYRAGSMFAESLLYIEKEQNKDLTFYKKQISDTEFIENIFHRKSPDIWIPSIKDLVKAGVVHEILTDMNKVTDN